jgi:hypothetical protein
VSRGGRLKDTVGHRVPVQINRCNIRISCLISTDFSWHRFSPLVGICLHSAEKLDTNLNKKNSDQTRFLLQQRQTSSAHIELIKKLAGKNQGCSGAVVIIGTIGKGSRKLGIQWLQYSCYENWGLIPKLEFFTQGGPWMWSALNATSTTPAAMRSWAN